MDSKSSLHLCVCVCFFFGFFLPTWGLMKKVVFQKKRIACIIFLEEIMMISALDVFQEEIMIECLFLNNCVAEGAVMHGEF